MNKERKDKDQLIFGLCFRLVSPKDHVFRTARESLIKSSNVCDSNIIHNAVMPWTLDIVYSFDYIDLVIIDIDTFIIPNYMIESVLIYQLYHEHL